MLESFDFQTITELQNHLSSVTLSEDIAHKENEKKVLIQMNLWIIMTKNICWL